jgi:hypothetical protein
MDDLRHCCACGALLVGPFDPGIAVTMQPSADDTEGEGSAATVWAWICPDCGLVTWYADDGGPGKLPEAEPAQDTSAKPATSYERRNQMMHMLRRVRRM